MPNDSERALAIFVDFDNIAQGFRRTDRFDIQRVLKRMVEKGKIVASSCPIKDDDNDPPCWRAKREYESIVDEVEGTFYCTGEYPKADAVEPLEFTIGDSGFDAKSQPKAAASNSLLRTAVASSGLSFPNKPVIPNKPAGFA